MPKRERPENVVRLDVQLSKALVTEMDKARGLIPRATWVRSVIEARLLQPPASTRSSSTRSSSTRSSKLAKLPIKTKRKTLPRLLGPRR